LLYYKNMNVEISRERGAIGRCFHGHPSHFNSM
jgi:hypothetical protein